MDVYNMGKYTNEQIANDWNLWIEYVDVDGSMDREEWEALTTTERIEWIESCFPLNE